MTHQQLRNTTSQYFSCHYSPLTKVIPSHGVSTLLAGLVKLKVEIGAFLSIFNKGDCNILRVSTGNFHA